MRAILEGIRLALRSIARSPLRASLTVLGILIGVAAVVIVTALGAGARDRVAGQIQSIGANFVIVFPQRAQASGARGVLGSGARLTEEDGRTILRESTSVVALAPVLRAAGQIVYGDQNWSTNIIGTTLPYFQVRNWPVTARRRVGAARRGRQIEGRPPREQRRDEALRHRGPGRPYDPHRPLPVPRARRDGDERGGPVRRRPGRLRHHADGELPVARAEDSPGVRGCALRVSELDRHGRPRRPPDRQRPPAAPPHRGRQAAADFEIHTQKEFAEMQAAVFGLLTLLLVCVAAISLFVGGIGVMNIMLVSVTERTREIGIRMAIGAREGDIRAQFLVEVASSRSRRSAGSPGRSSASSSSGPCPGGSAGPCPSAHVALVVSIGVSAVHRNRLRLLPRPRRAARLDPIEAALRQGAGNASNRPPTPSIH